MSEPIQPDECPFGCRDEDSPLVHCNPTGTFRYYVECSNGCRGPWASTRDRAVRLWNDLARRVRDSKHAPAPENVETPFISLKDDPEHAQIALLDAILLQLHVIADLVRGAR